MKLIDLTHPFQLPMPVYPGDPEPELLSIASLESEGYVDAQLTTGLHVGTHIDAPAHMIVGGKLLSDYSLDRFIGRGVLVDARGRSSITAALLRDVELRVGDMVLVLTGWSRWYRVGSTSGESVPTPEENPAKHRYFTDFPIVEESFAERLIDAGISILGLDTPSPDPSSPDGYERASEEDLFPIHHLLLENDILIAENLNRLERLANVGEFEVIALPTNLVSNAAPARIIARVA